MARSDVHQHKCRNCGHVWEHDSCKIETSKDAEIEHTCPCGTEEYNRYYPEGMEPKRRSPINILAALFEAIDEMEINPRR